MDIRCRLLRHPENRPSTLWALVHGIGRTDAIALPALDQTSTTVGIIPVHTESSF